MPSALVSTSPYVHYAPSEAAAPPQIHWGTAIPRGQVPPAAPAPTGALVTLCGLGALVCYSAQRPRAARGIKQALRAELSRGRALGRRPPPLMQALGPLEDDEGDDEFEVKSDLALTGRVGVSFERQMKTVSLSVAVVIVTLMVLVTFLFAVPSFVLIFLYFTGQAGYGAGEYELQRTLDLLQ